MMLEWLTVDGLWRTALAVAPMALLVAIACRWLPCRPSTRHALWMVVLVSFVALPLIPARVVTEASEAGRRLLDEQVETALAEPRTVEVRRAAPPPPVAPRPTTAWTTAPTFATKLPGPLAARRPAAEPRRIASAAPDPALPSTEAPVTATSRPEPVLAESRWVDGAGSSRAASAETNRWGAWATQLATIREAVMGLPPLPAGIWLGGLLVALLLAAARVRRARAVIRHATAAPDAMRAQVAMAARELRLRRTPETLMTAQRVSPMIWCGPRPRLILPEPLWAQLDEPGRQAVVLHELAHLRRRDHVVAWVQLAIGVLYWWHPVVWWTTRRLHEEADHCCDAWVMALRPTGRRAYAQALLDTRRFLSGPAPTRIAPVVGLAVHNRHTRRFARRLTMVMTKHTTPRFSIRGMALVATVAALACLVTPLLACPPESREEPKAAKAPKPPKAPKAPRVLRFAAPAAPAAPSAESATTFEQFMRDRDEEHDHDEVHEHDDDLFHEQDHDGGHGSAQLRIERLEQRLARMAEQLERALGRSRGRGADAAPLAPPPAPRTWTVPAPQAPGAVGFLRIGDGDDDCNKTLVRTYKLPDGKLEALTEIMIRSDVPVLVSPLEDGIEVHAKAAHQHIFALFVDMIVGDESSKAYEISDGKREALTELMIRSDVPVLVQPQPDGIKVNGTSLEQAVFGAFVDLIEGRSGGAAHAAGVTIGIGGDTETRALQEYFEAMGREGRRDGKRDAMRQYEAALVAMERRVEQSEREAERLMDRAERLEERAEDLEDRADEMEDDAEDFEGDRRRHALERAREVRAQARAMEQEARVLEEKARAVERVVEELEEKMEALEEEIEEAEEMAERADEHGRGRR